MHPSPRVFCYSLDWRFLLPTGEAETLTFLLEDNDEFRQALAQVGLDTSQQLSLSDLKQAHTNKVQSLVMPFGLPTSWVSGKYNEQVEIFSSSRRLMVSQGYLLVGFNNSWNMRASSRTKFHASTPRRITAQLRQAGFSSVKIFGAMPNLAIPEYIFDIDPRTIQFALHNRFRRKPAILRAVRVLAGTIGFARLSNFLPCYFAVAVV